MGTSLAYPTYTPPGTYNPGQTAPGTYNPYTGIGQGGNANIEGLYEGLGAEYYNEGQNFTTAQSNAADADNTTSAGYNNLTNQLYSPIWNGGGGYTAAQMAAIQQTGAQSNIESQLPGNQLTSAQQAAVTGNPYQAADTFQGDTANINSLIGQNATGLDQQVAGGQTNADTALSQMSSAYGAAIDPSQLQVSSSYMPTIQGELNTGASQLSSAESNPALGITPSYLQQAGMSDEQVQQTANEAASGVGAQFQATQNQLTQNAEAAGNATPMEVAAAQTALDRSSAASQQDAMTNATLQAQGAQRTAAQNVQNTQLNSGQYQSGLESSNALAEQNAGIAANTGAQQLNLSANQALTGYQMGAAGAVGQAGISEANAAASQGESALEYEGNAATSALTGQATEEAGLQGTAENAASQRALTLGTNQQATSESNEGMENTIQNEASGQAVSANAPWVSEQEMGLQEAPTQEQYYGSQGNTATSQGLQGTQMYMGGTENAAAGVAGRQSYDQTNSFGQQFSNAAGSNLGKSLTTVGGGSSSNGGGSYGYVGGEHGMMIDHHQLIQVGEHDRPEVVLPLDPRTPPEDRNMFEKLGAKLGDKWGVSKEGPVKGYANGGIVAGNDFENDLLGMDLAEDSKIPGYAMGGFVMPKMHIPKPTIHMPHMGIPKVRMTSPGVHLNMPIRFPRISAPIRPAGLPGISSGYTAKDIPPIPGYETGGIISTQAGQKPGMMTPKRNDYRMGLNRGGY